MEFPSVCLATVYQQVPDNYGLLVVLQGVAGGQMPVLPVRVASHGPRNAVQGDFPWLPAVGDSGIVVFPRGDYRNGVWIGSFESALIDASPAAAGNVAPKYRADYSGAWSWHGPDGTVATVLADGSSLLAGAALPQPTRHTLDATQARQRTPYTPSQRVAVPVGPLPLAVAHASGASVAVTAAGAVSASAAGGQGATISAGGATIAISGSGAVTITAPGTVTISGSGSASVVLTGGTVTISAGGAAQAVKLASGANSTVLMAQ